MTPRDVESWAGICQGVASRQHLGPRGHVTNLAARLFSVALTPASKNGVRVHL